jgi:hypothetical protein
LSLSEQSRVDVIRLALKANVLLSKNENKACGNEHGRKAHDSTARKMSQKSVARKVSQLHARAAIRCGAICIVNKLFW